MNFNQFCVEGRVVNLSFVSEVRKYLTSAKVVKKTILKALGNLKDLEAFMGG